MDDRRREAIAFLASLADNAIPSLLRYRSILGDPLEMPLGEMLLHCANQSTYHRGQLVTMLRQLGIKPSTTDYRQFVRATY